MFVTYVYTDACNKRYILVGLAIARPTISRDLGTRWRATEFSTEALEILDSGRVTVCIFSINYYPLICVLRTDETRGGGGQDPSLGLGDLVCRSFRSKMKRCETTNRFVIDEQSNDERGWRKDERAIEGAKESGGARRRLTEGETWRADSLQARDNARGIGARRPRQQHLLLVLSTPNLLWSRTGYKTGRAAGWSSQ